MNKARPFGISKQVVWDAYRGLINVTRAGHGIGWAGLPSKTLTSLLTGGLLDRRPDDKSRMSREVHVRFRESLGVKFPRATR